MTPLHVFGVLFLIGVNAFFAATEFSLVAVRLSRVRQLVEKGDPRAQIVEQLIGDLGRVVSGVQVGITLASLSLGYLGEITLAAILGPLVRDDSAPVGAARRARHGACASLSGCSRFCRSFSASWFPRD